MKANKNIVLGMAILVGSLTLGSSLAFAEGYGKKFTPADRAQKMKEKLSLTDEQTAKIQAIYEANKPSDAEVEAFKQKMQKVQSEVEAVLTPEQLEKYKAHRKEMKEKKDEGKHHGKHKD